MHAESHINFTTTKLRTVFRADTFDSFIFNTSNKPYLHEIHFAASVQLWGKEARQMGTTKEGIQSQSVSKVVRRHLATKTDTSLYKNCVLKTFSDIGAVKSTRIERQIELASHCP
jgi:hypothetical protein